MPAASKRQDLSPVGVGPSEVAITNHVLSVPRRSLRSPARHLLQLLLLGAFTIGLLPILAAAPAPVRLVTVPVAGGPWLDRFNAWRGGTGVSTLSENAAWSQGDVNHAVYMVKNNVITHYETVGAPYYTTDGDAAGQKSNIYVSSMTSTQDVEAIDFWMQAPFHALGMMDPRLTQTGFGSYREAVPTYWKMAAAVDVLHGNSLASGMYANPVYFPGNGSTEPLTRYGGGESPDPLTGPCAGYSAPTGLPIFIQIGGFVSTSVTVHNIVGNNAPTTLLENCVHDSSSPSVGSNMTMRGAAVLIPRLPLLNGVTYTVALTVNNVPYTWSFTVGPLAPAVFVTSVSPAAGTMAGGTTVTINGSGFTGATSIKFGATAATSFTFVSDSQVTAVSPAQAAGPVDVTVATATRGPSVISSADVFTFTGRPGPPLNATATQGNLSGTITWSPPASDGYSAITSYTVTSSPGGLTSTVSGSTFSTVIPGLSPGTNYTFTVVATNSNGPGTASAPSNQITAVTVPSAPTSVTATAADGSAILSWTAPPNGGSAIQGYVVTPYISGVAQTPVTFNQPNQTEAVFGLTNGATYTFTVTAFNVAGSGAGSGPSNSVTPNASLRQPTAQGPSSAAPGGRPPVLQSSPAPTPAGR